MLITQTSPRTASTLAAIRKAKLYDAPEIVAILNATIPPGGGTANAQLDRVTEAEMKQRITQDPLWVAIGNDGRVIGWCGLTPYYRDRPAFRGTRELSVYVDKPARGQGVATALVRHALSACSRLAVRTVVATVFSLNLPSVRLHESLDFRLVGSIRNAAVTGGVRRDLLIFAYDTERAEDVQ